MNIEALLKSIDNEIPDYLELNFSDTWMSFHPLVYSLIGALVLEVKSRGGSFKINGNENTLKLIKDIGLINLIESKGLKSIGECDGTVIPITVIKNNTEQKHFIQEIIPLLHATPTQSDALKYVFSEMIRNVLEHSKSNNGAVVCAQYFKSSNRVALGIADYGVGLKESLSKSYTMSSNKEAIFLALTPGITGTTSKIGGTPENAGAGLFFTKSIAKLSKNAFVLHSGNALYKLRRGKNDGQLHSDPMLDNHALREFDSEWHGTLVGVDFSLNDQPVFNDLLVKIREAYFVNIKNSNKEKYKKPRFI